MLKTRIITALVLLAIFVPVTLFSPIHGGHDLFGALIALVLIVAAWEWGRLLGLRHAWPIVYAVIAALVLLVTQNGRFISTYSLYHASAIFWIAAVPFALVRKPKLAVGPWRVFLALAGLVIFAACWHALVTARAIGVAFVLSLLLVVWLADIGAYFSGKAFGRHKLAPAISPGKTWEGVAGGWALVMAIAVLTVFVGAAGSSTVVTGAADGLASAAAATVTMANTATTATTVTVPGQSWLLPNLYDALVGHLGWTRALLGLTILVAFSVTGDLFESLAKRQAGVKDSSTLLPGHGGVLDRIDALLPVLPLAMLLLV
jgi:phosphatidate cytidylyltransferase